VHQSQLLLLLPALLPLLWQRENPSPIAVHPRNLANRFVDALQSPLYPLNLPTMTHSAIEIKVYSGPLAMQADLADWLELRPAVNNLLLGLLYRMARREADGGEVKALLVGVFQGDAPKLAFLWMPPRFEMVMVAAEDGYESALEAAAKYFSENKAGISGLVGPEPQASMFARGFVDDSKIVFRQFIWQLDRLVEPRPCKGEMRLAMPPDADLLAGWVVAFFKEALGREILLGDATQLVRGKILDRALYVWDDGGVQCMAGLERATRQGITVVLVYTPAAARGHGYASNLVGQMSAQALRDGRKFLCLHTDADFATSNKVYRDLGYYQVGEGLILSFE
jgi:uncharacterized protein